MKACIAVVLFAVVAVSMAAEPEAKENLKGSEAVYLASPYSYPSAYSYAYGTPFAYSGAYHLPAAVPAVYSHAIAPAAVPAVTYLRR